MSEYELVFPSYANDVPEIKATQESLGELFAVLVECSGRQPVWRKAIKTTMYNQQTSQLETYFSLAGVERVCDIEYHDLISGEDWEITAGVRLDGLGQIKKGVVYVGPEDSDDELAFTVYAENGLWRVNIFVSETTARELISALVA